MICHEHTQHNNWKKLWGEWSSFHGINSRRCAYLYTAQKEMCTRDSGWCYMNNKRPRGNPAPEKYSTHFCLQSTEEKTKHKKMKNFFIFLFLLFDGWQFTSQKFSSMFVQQYSCCWNRLSSSDKTDQQPHSHHSQQLPIWFRNSRRAMCV